MADFVFPAILLVAFMLAFRLATRGKYRNLSPAEALSLVQSGNFYVLDVRNAEELASGCLPGAHTIPLGQLRQRLSEIPRGPILVYCASGMRSRRAASLLSQAGYEEIVNLSGGFFGWSQQGLPVTRK